MLPAPPRPAVVTEPAATARAVTPVCILPLRLPEHPGQGAPAGGREAAAPLSRATLYAELRALSQAPRCVDHLAIACRRCPS